MISKSICDKKTKVLDPRAWPVTQKRLAVVFTFQPQPVLHADPSGVSAITSTGSLCNILNRDMIRSPWLGEWSRDGGGTGCKSKRFSSCR